MKKNESSTTNRSPGAQSTVHVAITCEVRPGCEAEFEGRAQEFFAKAALEPGVTGAYLMRPFIGAPSQEYGILRSFESLEAQERFYESRIFKQWNEAVTLLVVGEPQRHRLHSMEGFFDSDGGPPPPRWKMSLLIWVAVSPAVYFFVRAVPAVLPGLPGVVELLVVNAFVVVALSWILMPLLTKLFANWLNTDA